METVYVIMFVCAGVAFIAAVAYLIQQLWIKYRKRKNK